MADNLLPQTVLEEVEMSTQPGKTYNLDIDKKEIVGMTDEQQAVLQAIYLILSTERYVYPIYSHNYGVELENLIGMPRDYVTSELKRRIEDALTQDDRIQGVSEWEFEYNGKIIKAKFTVNTIYGDINAEKEVTL